MLPIVDFNVVNVVCFNQTDFHFSFNKCDIVFFFSNKVTSGLK